MSVYNLLQQSATLVSANPQLPCVGPPGPGNPNMPPALQQFEIRVTGVAGATVSGTAQVYGTNDPPNRAEPQTLVPIGDPITATGIGTAAAAFTSNQPWTYFTAALTALTGTRAAVRMSC